MFKNNIVFVSRSNKLIYVVYIIIVCNVLSPEVIKLL